MNLNLAEIGPALRRVFGSKAEAVARETQLVQRRSKLTGLKFLQIWVVGFLENPAASLNFLAQVAADFGVPLTKQGLQERLACGAVAFLKTMFDHAKAMLQGRLPIALPLLTQFTAILITDSSEIAVPDRLQATFPGAGGDGPKATLKLQTIWEFLCGNLVAVFTRSGVEPDQTFRQHVAQIVPGALYLSDLGYFALATLQQIVQGQAYFISRFLTGCGLVEPSTGQPFDLLAYLRRTRLDQVELPLWLGVKVHLPCRLLAVRLPAEVVAERRRKAKRDAQRKGRQLSAEKLAWLEWEVLITNVPVAMLSLPQVMLLYRLRWQIELLFKLWKSELLLDRIAGQQTERVLCEIYAKLIGSVLFLYLTAPLRWGERELSATKAVQTFRRHILELIQALEDEARLGQVLEKLYARWERFGLKDRRRKRLTTCQQIALAGASP